MLKEHVLFFYVSIELKIYRIFFNVLAIQDYEHRIIGGTDADIWDFPFMASLRTISMYKLLMEQRRKFSGTI